MPEILRGKNKFSNKGGRKKSSFLVARRGGWGLATKKNNFFWCFKQLFFLMWTLNLRGGGKALQGHLSIS